MVMPDHLCPYGLKSKDLLERNGFDVDDHHLTSRAETERFMAAQQVDTTPQTYIAGERIGGHDALREYFGEDVPEEGDTTYRPVIAVFAMAALMALASSWAMHQAVLTLRAAELFIAFSMCILAIQKLRDIEAFSTMFLNYDLLAQRWVRYGYLYPFGEALAGILMIAGALTWLSVPIAFVIGAIGAVSVIKAVYVDRRQLKCACVGGDTNVPLGAISLTENVMMVAMAVWMTVKPLVL